MYKHKNSNKVLELMKPDYGKHWGGTYGYLIATNAGVFFFYGIEDNISFEDVTKEYDRT